MTKQELKQLIFEAIDQHSAELENIAQTILSDPELGFKEYKTSSFVQDALSQLGLSYQKGLALTGVKSMIPGRSPGPTVGVFGELDAIKCPLHPMADSATGAAHACGHCYQVAAMLGVAYGLIKSGAMNWLDGSVALLAVPAEEMISLNIAKP